MTGKNSLLFLCIAHAFICHAQAKKNNYQTCRIEFRNMADTTLIHVDSTYKNAFGEVYTLRTLKYYISNIMLRSVDNKSTLFRQSHLVNEADSNSKVMIFKIPKQRFNQLSFSIGVDSLYNVSGTQTGDLDPLKGMFWTWNTGYINAKMEATSNASTAANNKVAYHIGGYKLNEQTTRKVVLALPSPTLKELDKIVIEANVNKWFDGIHQLRISVNPTCTKPGKLATEFADNFSKMFKIVYIK